MIWYFIFLYYFMSHHHIAYIQYIYIYMMNIYYIYTRIDTFMCYIQCPRATIDLPDVAGLGMRWVNSNEAFAAIVTPTSFRNKILPPSTSPIASMYGIPGIPTCQSIRVLNVGKYTWILWVPKPMYGFLDFQKSLFRRSDWYFGGRWSHAP